MALVVFANKKILMCRHCVERGEVDKQHSSLGFHYPVFAKKAVT
ncbi:MAG: hypothetical protein BMS9Abin08_1826 [Gammaproteobacteria bacterium]|nr:MAG: hypothetical protein BMS9Abin08_1826 [Gammaproteobacteria bacterium]